MSCFYALFHLFLENNVIEYGEYKSVKSRQKKLWSLSSCQDDQRETSIYPKTTIKNQAKLQSSYITAEKALDLAKTDVHRALSFLFILMPSEVLTHKLWCIFPCFLCV